MITQETQFNKQTELDSFVEAILWCSKEEPPTTYHNQHRMEAANKRFSNINILTRNQRERRWGIWIGERLIRHFTFCYIQIFFGLFMQKHALFRQNMIYAIGIKKNPQIIYSLFYLSLSAAKKLKGEQNKKGFLIGLMQSNFT